MNLTKTCEVPVAEQAEPKPLRRTRAEKQDILQRSLAKLPAMPRISDIGLGAGIDADDVYRHVRVPDIDGRSAEWRAKRAADVSTAMRDFVQAIPAADKLSPRPDLCVEDFDAALQRGGLTAKRLIERAAAFRAEVERLLPLLAEAIARRRGDPTA